MPKINGLECLAELKKSGKIKSTRLILYSNYIDEEMYKKAVALGVHHCIQKPAMIHVLLKILKDILQN
jgi:DNA-binding NarL/FixJ family response regulator